MFDKISDAAEKLASNVSRRHILGSIGRWAGATALAMAGVLGTAGTAQAGNVMCCFYHVPGNIFCFTTLCVASGGACPDLSAQGLQLWNVREMGNCKKCHC